jgi:uncharacterized protein YjaZ
MRLHLLNSSGKLTDYQQIIEKLFEKNINFISTLLEVDKVDVVIGYSKNVIPETGVGGFSPSANIVYLSFDPDNKNFKHNFELEFLAMLGHELHHCMRYRGPGYGSCLRDALISEGLACHFETELRNGSKPFYANLASEKSNKFFQSMQNDLDNIHYDHNAWFFGSKAKKIQRHTGYKVGFNIVNKYITKTAIPASQLWAKPTGVFF